MITFLLVAILGAVLLVVIMQLMKKPGGAAAPPSRTAPPPPPVQDLANLTAADARAGDALSISGAGDEMTDLDFTADRMTNVEAGARRWFELSGPYHGRRVTLRVASEEELETCLHAAPRPVTLEDLGLSEDDLAQMDERQNTADQFEFDGKVWLYRFSREARSWREDNQRPAGHYYWEFQEQGGGDILGVRKAEGEPFSVVRYSKVPADNVTVYRSR